VHAGFKTVVVANAKAICDTDATTGADLRAALETKGIAVHTTEGDARSLVWTLPVVFELPPDDDGEEEEEEEDDDSS
jgi:hypothetical protein